jgi:hypothetical protein
MFQALEEANSHGSRNETPTSARKIDHNASIGSREIDLLHK